MKQSELENYQSLNAFQKSVVDALKNMGFEYNSFSTYEKSGYGKIKVKKIRNIQDLFEKVYQAGKDSKRFEILGVLGL
jgi:hypothetical protein